ncbi:MAG TPA: hypothetical protein VE129_18600 [Thermoanaerobaculia bacterium]|nr:hypothetical protein [Thermoanaerobaculia bacterium]
MFKALKAFRSLSPEQKALLETKQVSGEYEPRGLIELLRPIAEYDRLSDKARTPMGCSTAALFVLSFVLFVVAANVSFFLLPLSLLALGGAVYLLVTVLRLRKLDLSNNFRQVAMPLFAVLKEDMDAGATMNVRIDLSPPTAKAKKTGTGKPYKEGDYYKIVDTTFVDPWFGGGTRLADGSLLQWDVTDDVVESARTKRTARGKHKTKTKYRKLSTINVTVALPHKEYAVTNLPADEGEKVKVRESEKRTTFRLAKRVKLKSNDPIDPVEVFDIISEAYKRVRPAAAVESAS